MTAYLTGRLTFLTLHLAHLYRVAVGGLAPKVALKCHLVQSWALLSTLRCAAGA